MHQLLDNDLYSRFYSVISFHLPFPTPMWHIANTPIILASQSASRRAILDGVRIDYSSVPANIDEVAIRSSCEAEELCPENISVILAEMKAQLVAQSRTDALVIGSDQILECQGKIFGKPSTRKEACETLFYLQGKSHQLFTAVVVFKYGQRIWHHNGLSTLAVRPLSVSEISDYLDILGDAAFQTAGCYQIEGVGAHLFTTMSGTHYDILGLPLLPLLAFLREHGLTRGGVEVSR